MTTKHTPGPWQLKKVKTSVGHCYKIGSFQACLYVDNYTMHEDETQAANARLIAAAPELLEALREAAQYYQDSWEEGGQTTEHACVTKWRGIIAKAKGED